MRSHKHMKAIRSIVVTALAVMVGACSDSTGPGLTGDFSGTVTGDQTKSLEGDAFFSFGTVFGSPANFALLLLEGGALGESDGFILIGRGQQDRPAVGTYAIVGEDETPDPAEFVATWFPTGEEGGEFVSTSGSVTITSSSSRRLRGTFEFDAVGSAGDPPALTEITISGSFDAVFVNENGSPVSRISSVTVKRTAVR